MWRDLSPDFESRLEDLDEDEECDSECFTRGGLTLELIELASTTGVATVAVSTVTGANSGTTGGGGGSSGSTATGATATGSGGGGAGRTGGGGGGGGRRLVDCTTSFLSSSKQTDASDVILSVPSLVAETLVFTVSSSSSSATITRFPSWSSSSATAGSSVSMDSSCECFKGFSSFRKTVDASTGSRGGGREGIGDDGLGGRADSSSGSVVGGDDRGEDGLNGGVLGLDEFSLTTEGIGEPVGTKDELALVETSFTEESVEIILLELLLATVCWIKVDEGTET